MSAEPNEPVPMHQSADDETLAAIISARARRTSDGQLAMAVAVGLAGVFAIGILRPGWWRLALPLTTLAAFGAWGIADRVAMERRATPGSRGSLRMFDAIRWTAVIVGTLSLVVFVLALTATAIGTWNL